MPRERGFAVAAGVNAGAAYEGEAQSGPIDAPISLTSSSTSFIDAPAPREASADGEGFSMLETKVGELFQKHEEM